MPGKYSHEEYFVAFAAMLRMMRKIESGKGQHDNAPYSIGHCPRPSYLPLHADWRNYASSPLRLYGPQCLRMPQMQAQRGGEYSPSHLLTALRRLIMFLSEANLKNNKSLDLLFTIRRISFI